MKRTVPSLTIRVMRFVTVPTETPSALAMSVYDLRPSSCNWVRMAKSRSSSWLPSESVELPMSLSSPPSRNASPPRLNHDQQVHGVPGETCRRGTPASGNGPYNIGLMGRAPLPTTGGLVYTRASVWFTPLPCRLYRSTDSPHPCSSTPLALVGQSSLPQSIPPVNPGAWVCRRSNAVLAITRWVGFPCEIRMVQGSGQPELLSSRTGNSSTSPIDWDPAILYALHSPAPPLRGLSGGRGTAGRIPHANPPL